QIVKEQVSEGKSPDQIRGWFAKRYGDEVLLDPPRRSCGWLLWILPLGLIGGSVVLLLRRRTGTAEAGAPAAASSSDRSSGGSAARRAVRGSALAVAAMAVTAGTWTITALVDDRERTPAEQTSGSAGTGDTVGLPYSGGAGAADADGDALAVAV